MITRTFLGKKITAIGLGVMALDEYKPAATEEEALAVLRKARDMGVGLFDTADVYGLGRNELLLGKAFPPEEQKNMIIATKAGCIRPGGTEWDTDGRPEHIRKSVEGSIDRLGIKKITLYQLHAPDHRTPLKETLKAFKELQENGVVHHIGLSNVSLSQLQLAERVIDVVSVQNHFNIAHKGDEEDLLPYLTKNTITYLPYFPLSSGRLLQDQRVQQLAHHEGITTSQLLLAWIITKWPTAIPIPGTKNRNHLEENMRATERELPERVVKKVDELY